MSVELTVDQMRKMKKRTRVQRMEWIARRGLDYQLACQYSILDAREMGWHTPSLHGWTVENKASDKGLQGNGNSQRPQMEPGY
jgi:hypothetical protein